MKRPILLFLPMCLMLLVGCNEIDPPGQEGTFIRVYGTDETDHGKAVAETADGGFIIAGSQTNMEVPANKVDVVLIRTDEDGYLLWRKTYGAEDLDRAEDILVLGNDGFLVVGQTATGMHGGTDVMVLRTDAQGDSLWYLELGGSGEDVAYAAARAANGDILITGYTNSPELDSATQNFSHIYAARITSEGAVLWENGYGAANEEVGTGIAVVGDSCVIVGYHYDNDIGYNMMVMKLGIGGDTAWTYRGSVSKPEEYGSGVIVLDNGDIVCSGYSEQDDVSDIVVRRLSADGDSMFHVTHGKSDDEFADSRHLILSGEGEIVIGGRTKSLGEGSDDIYLFSVKNDASFTAGNLNETFGGSNEDYAAAVIRTSDGGFAIVGYSKSFSFNDEYDIVLVRTNAQGSVVQD